MGLEEDGNQRIVVEIRDNIWDLGPVSEVIQMFNSTETDGGGNLTLKKFLPRYKV